MATKVLCLAISLAFVVCLLLPSALTAKANTKNDGIEENFEKLAELLKQFNTEKPKEKQEARLSPSTALTEQENTNLAENIWEKTLRMLKTFLFDPLMDVLEDNLKRFIPVFDVVTEIFNAVFINEECSYSDHSCPKGLTKKANPHHTPSSNGCGAYGIQFRQWYPDFLPHEAFEDCCEQHDLCYDTCGSDRDHCDLRFKRCLNSVCKSHVGHWRNIFVAGCKSLAKMIYTGTQAAACITFEESQAKACICVPTEHRSTEF